MTNETLFLLLFIVLVIGVLPAWPYSRGWGYGPTGALSVVLIVIALWVLMGGGRELRSPGENLKSDLQSTGQDLKEMGREAADSVRDAVN